MTRLPENIFIEANELSNQLNNTIVLDCRFSLVDPQAGINDYRQGHIPGAFYCDLNQHLSNLNNPEGGRHPLPEAGDFFQQLRRWGIGPQSQVVVYDDQRFAFASRAWWLLRAAGIADVRLLNGGYKAWTNTGNPQDRRSPAEKTLFALPPQKALLNGQQIKNHDDIFASLSNSSLQLVDSREAFRYNGESEPIDPIAGHIPGAVNFPWTDVSDENGMIKPLEFHRQRWQSLTHQDGDVVVYCGSGVTACVNLLSAKIAGHDFALYPGSWSEWCSQDQPPVATRQEPSIG
ncbi:MAG: sulfurtransferase [Cellvibrionaceae bacterium]|nr:sulfurtransferase [Cellvibrionaceae bacterium]|tara:strand:+ start:18097 stop:18966 length:870 start_codon:yes stop_codon:yes gene_type:complete